MLSDAEVIEGVKRRSRYAAAVVHREMNRGLTTLANITSIAPFVGLLSAILGIVDSFPACGAERSACMAAIFERLSEALAPVALGLFTAILAIWEYRYLNGVTAAFDREMGNMSCELVNYLIIHLRRRTQ